MSLVNWFKKKTHSYEKTGLSYEEARISSHIVMCLESGEKFLFDKGDSRIIDSLIKRSVLDGNYFQKLSAGLYKII